MRTACASMRHEPPLRRAVLAHAASLFLSSLVLLPVRAPALAAAAPVLAVSDLKPDGTMAGAGGAERRLFELSQRRWLGGWTAEERPTVDALVEELVALGRQTSWSRHSP